MKKRTLILTKEQLDEISGGNYSYLDALATKPDMGNVFSSEIMADGTTDSGYADNIKTDDYEDSMSRQWPMDSWSYRNGSCAPGALREMKKSDWEEANLFNEEDEHGNARLNNRKFGNSDKQYSYGAIKQKEYRERKAVQKMLNGGSQEEKESGRKSLNKILNNDSEAYDKAKKQFDNAKSADKILQSTKPEGTKHKSSSKIGSNGLPSVESGIITPID